MAEATRPLALIWRYRRYYANGGLSLIVTNLCDTALPLVLKLAIDDIVIARGLLPLWAVGALYLALVALLALYRYFWRFYFLGASHRIALELRTRLFAHLERLSPSFFQRTLTGDLMSRATNDVQATRMLFAIGLLLSIDTVMYLAIIPPAMIVLAPRLALYTLLPLLAIPAFVYVMGRVVHRRSSIVQERFGEMAAAVEETVAGMRVVKGFAQEPHRAKIVRGLGERYVADNMRLQVAQGLFQPLIALFMTGTLVIAVVVGGRMALEGAITIGSFVAFQHYLLKLAWPMRAVGMTVNIYQRGLASLARLDQVLAEEPEVRDGPWTEPGLEVEEGAIELDRLTFRFPHLPPGEAAAAAERASARARASGGKREGASPVDAAASRPPALVDVSLSIAAGETIALVGPIGAGKSTLLGLLPRLFDAPEGSIRVDGQPLRRFPLEALRRAIAFVPQETFLFGASVAENLTLGRPDATEQEIREAAAQAGVLEDLDALPEGLASLLGERGVNLSGGQRQRLAITRAILRRPRILLLDDCLSAVDTETEAKILQGLREARRGRTTLIASHRLQAVRDADRIVCLDAGRIVESGTHDELIAQGGLYARLWERQQLEHAIEVTR